jgi:hypothetical protein
MEGAGREECRGRGDPTAGGDSVAGGAVGRGDPRWAPTAGSWQLGGREGEKKKRNLALYHVGNSNPNSGWVFVLIDQVRRA